MGELAFKITVKDDGSAVLEKFGGKAEDVGKRAAGVGKRISASFTKVRGVLGRLPGAVFNLRNAIIGLGAVVAIRALVGRFAAFEAEMLRVGVLAGATGGELKSLTNLALELGETTAFSAKQASEGMVFLAKAGFETNEIMKALPGTLELAAAAGLDLATSADIVTNVTKGLQLPISELGRANDVLVQAFTSSNVSLIELGESFRFVGPVAISSGLQFEEVTATLGLLGDAGIKGGAAGTTLRASIARLIAPSKEAGKILGDLGVKAVEPTTGKLRPFADILEQLGKSGADNADIFRIFGLRAGPGIATLLAQGADSLREMTKELEESGGRAKEVAEVRLKGLSGALVIMRSAVDGAVIRIGEQLAPTIKELAGFITVLARNLSTAIKGFTDTAKATGETKETVSGLRTALDAILPGVEFLVDAFFRVRKSITEVSALFTALKLTFLLVSKGINTAIGFLVTGFIKIQGTAGTVFDAVRRVIGNALAFVIRLIADVVREASKLAANLSPLSDSAAELSKTLTVAATEMKGFALDVSDANDQTTGADIATKALTATTDFFAGRERNLREAIAETNGSLNEKLDALAIMNEQQKRIKQVIQDTAAAERDATKATKELTSAIIEGGKAEPPTKAVKDLTVSIRTEVERVTDLLSQTGLPALQQQFADAAAEIVGTGPKANRAVAQLGAQFQVLADTAAKVPEGLRDEFEKIVQETKITSDNVNQIAEESLAKTLALQSRRRQALASGTAKLFGVLAAAAETGGEKAFKIGQAFAAGQAVISGIQAVQAALAGPPGPPFSLPLAAAIAIQTALNVRKILQARPGAGAGAVSGAAAGGGGGGGPSAPVGALAEPAVAVAGAPTQQIEVSVAGFVGDEALLASEIGRVLREGESDGVQVNVAS